MEPVDPVDDFLTTRGTLQKTVTLSVFDVTKDQGNSTDSPWATAIPIRGSHGVERTSGGQGVGDIVTTTTDWWITTLTADFDALTRPTLRSKITSCGKTWLILSIDPNPRNGRLFFCPGCQLLPST